MIPLILLALGLGAALTVYELSPRARARVDTFVRAIRSASVAHQTADARLANANAHAVTAVRHTQQANAARQAAAPQTVAPPYTPAEVYADAQAPVAYPPYTPAEVYADAQANAANVATDAAVDQAAAAIEANKDAAKNTAVAAQNAQTEAERQEVVQSAAKVLERENNLASMLDSLGIGQCDVKTYPGVTEQVKDALLAKLRAEGMAVTGDNPWDIDTGKYGVKLRAIWDWRVNKVMLIVTAGKGNVAKDLWVTQIRVSCQDIWDEIDPIMKEVIG